MNFIYHKKTAATYETQVTFGTHTTSMITDPINHPAPMIIPSSMPYPMGSPTSGIPGLKNMQHPYHRFLGKPVRFGDELSWFGHNIFGK